MFLIFNINYLFIYFKIKKYILKEFFETFLSMIEEKTRSMKRT